MMRNAPIDLELAKQAIGEHRAAGNGVGMSIQTILDAITEFDVRLTDLLSKRRRSRSRIRGRSACTSPGT